jgi:hypothetical protein
MAEGLSMIHAPKIYANPGELQIPITVDEDVAGVQFDLWYDPSSSYVSIQFASGASGLVNEIAAGHLKVAFSGPQNLPNPVCTITLNISESTVVDISNAVGATEQAESIDLIADDGEVLVGVPMQLFFQWQDSNPANVGVIDCSVYQGTQNNPSSGTWTKIVTVPVNVNEAYADVDPDQGTLYFYAAARNALGEGPPTNVASLGTDLPIALENLTVEIT